MGQVTHTVDPRDYRTGSTLYDVAHGDLQLAYGAGTDTDKPLEDTRDAYCLAPLGRPRHRPRPAPCRRIRRPRTSPRSSFRVLLDFSSQAAIAVENARLYEETRRLLEETSRPAFTDSLTGIPNRRAMNGMLERERHTSERYDTALAFQILDLERSQEDQRLGRPQPRRPRPQTLRLGPQEERP